MKERKPRYTLCNIVTNDKDLLILSDDVRAKGYSHEEIYRAGLEALSNNSLSQD